VVFHYEEALYQVYAPYPAYDPAGLGSFYLTLHVTSANQHCSDNEYSYEGHSVPLVLLLRRPDYIYIILLHSGAYTY